MPNMFLFPPELWLEIFDYLDQDSVLTLRSVHRELASYGLPYIWRTVTLGDVCGRYTAKAKALISNPHLSTHIRRVNFIIDKACIMGDQGFSWEDVRQAMDLYHPIESIQILKNPRLYLLQTWIKAATHLSTTYQELRLFTNLPPTHKSGEFLDPQIQRLYSQLLDTLLGPGLQKLKMEVPPAVKALEFVAEGFRKRQNTFLELKGVDLQMYNKPDNHQLKSGGDFNKILTPSRHTVRKLAFRLPQNAPPSEMLTCAGLLGDFLNSVGSFPRLGRVSFTLDRALLGQQSLLLKYQHSPSISYLRLGSSSSINSISSSISDSPLTPPSPWSLPESVSLVIHYKWIESLIQPWLSSRMDYNNPFRGTLASLVITESKYEPSVDEGIDEKMSLSRENLERLIFELGSSGNGTVLKRFKFTIRALDPDVFDLLSKHLPELEILDIRYVHLTASRSSGVRDPEQFWKNMHDRPKYEGWNVKQIYVAPSREDLVENAVDPPVMHQLSQRIPSVVRFSPYIY